MGFGAFYIDSFYMYLVVPAILICLLCSFNVNMTFKKYNNYSNKKGYTGYDVARKTLDDAGLYNVGIEYINGKLSDHFDPRSNVVRLSQSTYNNTSIGAIGVAVHEVGHAIQYSRQYFPLVVRNSILKPTQIGATLSMPLIFIGFLSSVQSLVVIGILLFSIVTIFQLITLPVEFNASNRAMKIIEQNGILDSGERKIARKVLNAAALTYVASLMLSIANLLRLILLANRRNQ